MDIDVLCIGHAAYDISMFVEALPVENSKCEADDLVEAGGGPAANAAYLLSSWGNRCAFAGLIGDDAYGRRIAAEFQAAGTDISLLKLEARHATPLSILLINKSNGSRTVVNRKIKGRLLELTETAFRTFTPKILLFDGHEPSASLAALQAYPEAISILDAGSWREGTALLAGQVDFLAASERFALRATGTTDLVSENQQCECVAALRQKYKTIVIVTLGERGLIADAGEGFFHLPAFPAKAIDTTAAGDIFHGAFAHALLHDMPLREALRFASMAASLSVRVAGGRNSIPKLEQVTEELRHA